MELKTAVIYARVSSVSDRQSTDRQVVDLRAFAQREGIEVVGVYDEHESGAREDRPELLRCMEFLKGGGCSTLLVSEISRLGRTVKGVVNAAARWQREPDGEGHPDHPRPGSRDRAKEYREPTEQRQGKGEGEGRENGSSCGLEDVRQRLARQVSGSG